jgi:alpha,alpha-trehalose-phosphate synthase [UDP-forming]
MRIFSLRLILALIVGITLVSLISSWYEIQSEKNELVRDLENKASSFGESFAASAESLIAAGDQFTLKQLANQFGSRDHMLGVGIFDQSQRSLAVSRGLEPMLQGMLQPLGTSLHENRITSRYMRLHFRQVYLLAIPLHAKDKSVAGGVVLAYDTDFIRDQILRVWSQVFIHIAIQVLVIAGITLLIVRWSMAGPVTRLAHWIKELRTGRHPIQPSAKDLGFLSSLSREVAPLVASMRQARTAAETEAKLRNTNDSLWTAQRLADHVRNKLDGNSLFVVSNREPYIHSRQNNRLTVAVPASGLVTAVEPILRACDGTWIAHGSGDADAEAVDSHDRLRVPPEEPRYTLRRVWLSEEEESGYYNGFSNEGLWPLCHIAHTRPVFRATDWEHYINVNRKFADALVGEINDEQHPVVLIQDYHFALLPRMIKDRIPHARVAIFWHIPWPNPESFGICPWQRELLDGLLGADLIGFHVQAHCNNFLDTVDRVLEARVDWEHFSIKRNDHWSSVHPFPISVDVPDDTYAGEELDVYEERERIISELGIDAIFLGLGVDRVDYTKGILERFQAVESFLKRYPNYQGKFTFVQIGAPSRSRIRRYADFQSEVEAEARRINASLQRGKWKPIVFLNRQHDHLELQRYYRVAHLCMVTSLHDGMNLVAKEYVAARKDERGMLILSRFTGAARELRDAIIVNPYDIESTADAIARALTMDSSEMADRMHRMRRTVKEHNIFWWAGCLIGELCDLRLKKVEDITRVMAHRTQ